MAFLLLTFPILANLLFAAHLLFHGQAIWMVLPAVLILALFLGRRWIMRAEQIALLAFFCEWLRTAYGIYERRVAFDQPWLVAVLIIGAVAIFTLLSALVFEISRIKSHYRAPRHQFSNR